MPTRTGFRSASAAVVTAVLLATTVLAAASSATASSAPTACGTTTIPPATTGCELDGPVTPPPAPGQPASRDLGVAVAIPTPRPYPDCASAPAGATQCVVYLSAAVITGVSAEGYSDGTVVPGGATETGDCVGKSACDVTVGFMTTGTLAVPDVEVDAAYQYGTGFTLSGGGPAMFAAVATASFLAPTGNVTKTGAISISSVTISPAVPKSSDAKITGTVVVTNPATDTVTGIVVHVASNTPKIVTVTGAPKPVTVASLAAGASTKVTFELKPHKAGDASLAVTATAHHGTTALTAKPRTRKFTVDGDLKLKLAVTKGPDSAGKTTVRATVTNPGLTAASGVQLTLLDTTGARVAAKVGKPDPASFSLGGHDSRSFTVVVHLPEVGKYTFAGTARGRIGGVASEGTAKLALTRKGTDITVAVKPVFASPQIDEPGHLSVKVTNHLNEDLSTVATKVKAVVTSDSGKATIGTIPAPLASVAGSATVTIPVTLTYPGKVSFTVKVSGHGATTGRAVSDAVSAEVTVKKPIFTVKPTTEKQYANDAFAEDFKGTDWSTAGGPIDLLVAGTNAHTYSQRAEFHGAFGLPLWPNHTLGGQNKKSSPANACSATVSAKQGAYRKDVKVEGKTDRLLVFADADPLLTTNMLLCDKEINYVRTTPGTAMYFGSGETSDFGKAIKLTVIQAGAVVVNAVAEANLNICVNLTDGVRSVTVKAAGPQLNFKIAPTRCGASHFRR